MNLPSTIIAARFILYWYTFDMVCTMGFGRTTQNKSETRVCCNTELDRVDPIQHSKCIVLDHGGEEKESELERKKFS